MSVGRDGGKVIRVTARSTRRVARGVRATASGTAKAATWVRRNVGNARQRGGVGNVGMMRLLDLHAISCAGDTLITIGLAGTIFFSVPAGEARGRVALYLLVTMIPFALLAPVVGPVLDRFRHGRRYALATTMLGRAALAWIIADNLFGFGLYPAAFGVLALSRAYGVARSAAVPRLLPPGMGLSQAGARSSVYGTVAGAVVAPLGAAAFWFGPQWPLRVASIVFLAGVVVAFSLPPRADSDPPEVIPKAFYLPWRQRAANGDRVLSGELVLTVLSGSAIMRALYGFLLLFLAFAVSEGHLSTTLLGIRLGDEAALGVLGGSLVVGTFLSTAIGTTLHIRRPVRLQAIGLGIVAIAGMWAMLSFTLTAAALLCLTAAIASGLAKLAVDASIQERIGENVRASAFAHAETLLMLAWVAGAAFGLIPINGRAGLAVATTAVTIAAVRRCVLAWQMRADSLHGKISRGILVPAATRPGGSGSSPATGRLPESRTADPNPHGYGQRRVSPSSPPRSPEQPRDQHTADADGDADNSDPEEPPPGFHVFRPSADDGMADPRISP